MSFYVKKLLVENSGPISELEVEFPFDQNKPKPVVLVGPNGSGKSLVLSNIVNALLVTKSRAYQFSSETQRDQVFKVRSPRYVKSGKEYSYVRVDFDNASLTELTLVNRKKHLSSLLGKPIRNDVIDLLKKMSDHEYSSFDFTVNRETAKKLMKNNCVLYFPPNHFEEPAWQNTENLTYTPKHAGIPSVEELTDRKIISHSVLKHNQDWIFNLFFDAKLEDINSNSISPWSVCCNLATHVLRSILDVHENVVLSFGTRQNRQISIQNVSTKQNTFYLSQLSSGELTLLNIFWSIIRDFESTGTLLTNNHEIHGIVVVDEIDIHLHTRHKFEILPQLMALFPYVQFIVTSHSPLLILGLEKQFGRDGFEVRELPLGERILPEEFGEFKVAYTSFAATRRYINETQNAVENTKKPVVFLEGKTDKQYLDSAICKLGMDELAQKIEIRSISAGGGKANLKKVWDGLKRTEGFHQTIVLLFDSDSNISNDSWPLNEVKPWLYRRILQKIENNPIKKGIENLFTIETLSRACEHKKAFIDIEAEHEKSERGQQLIIPETWTVNEDEKTNLCDWLCNTGTAQDFENFRLTLEMLEDLLLSNPKSDVA